MSKEKELIDLTLQEKAKSVKAVNINEIIFT